MYMYEMFSHSHDQTADSEYSVLIKGKEDINRAVDGDQVILEMYPKNQWKAESDLLITNENEGNENAVDSESANANRMISGRIVGIARRNWRSYCGSLEIVESGTAVNYVFLFNPLFIQYLFDPVNRRVPKIRIKTSQYSKLMNKRIVVAINDWPVTSNYPIGHYVK